MDLRRTASGAEPREGLWDYDGACCPSANSGRLYRSTFSVGCFQWVRAKSGGLKRGLVAKRFSGSTSDPDAVYTKAQAWCAAMNKEASDGSEEAGA